MTELGEEIAGRYSQYYRGAAELLRQGFPELPEQQTIICQLLAQIPEESLMGLCSRQRNIVPESAAS